MKILGITLLLIWAVAVTIYVIDDTCRIIKELKEEKKMETSSITKQFTCSQEAMNEMNTKMEGLTVGQAIEQLKQLPQDTMLYAFDSKGLIDRAANIDLVAYNFAFVHTKDYYDV